MAPVAVAPGQTVTTQTRLIAGAKEKACLDRYEDAGIPKLSKSIDWGWFEFHRPIFALLICLFRLTGNFGFAIMGLTLIVRRSCSRLPSSSSSRWPRCARSSRSSKAIQERFKDDKQRQQQEILEALTSRRRSIRPPARLQHLLQIPVFMRSTRCSLVLVEMRHAALQSCGSRTSPSLTR